MARKKFALEFTGIEEYIAKLEQLGGDIKKTTADGLEETHKLVTAEVHKSIVPHRRSGRTERSIEDAANVEWSGFVASVKVGYSISRGGLASVFLMYGTPRMRKDPKVYNAIYGATIKKKVREIQKSIVIDAINKRM